MALSLHVYERNSNLTKKMGSLEQSGCVLVLCIHVGIVFGAACSTQDRADNLAGCLNEIKSIMYNADAFWFGNSYSTDCANGGVLCPNPSPTQSDSLATRVLPSSYNPDLLTRFIHVRYTSDPGQYTGCGNTFTFRETRTFDIDPTSSQIVNPWHVRHIPEMTWDSTPGEYYSLYVYDAGYYFTHAVYINIQGNDIPTTGDNVISMYRGSLIPTNLNNPYVFLLFKQSGYLNPAVAREWYGATNSPNSLAIASHIPDFITLLNMTGPIGINWMVATGDEYSADIMASRGFVSACPIYIGRALDQKSRPFLPNPASLSVKMDMTFQVTELTYSVCCSDYRESSRQFMLNPIGNELLLTSTARSGLAQQVSFEKMVPFGEPNTFTDDMYTMIALDPDVPSQFASVGTESRPLLHQMKINIVDGDFMTGEDVISWNGPAPPNDEPHYYYFLLYKHAQSVTGSLMTSYAADCGERLAGRCLYDINTAVSENNFTLVGANWFRAVKDPYVRYRNIQSNPDSTESQCFGQPGYTLNCEETSGVSNIYINIFTMFVVVTVCVTLFMV